MVEVLDEVMRSVPSKDLPGWMSALMNTDLTGDDGLKAARRQGHMPLDALGDANARAVCGYIFRRGDIAWNCRSRPHARVAHTAHARTDHGTRAHKLARTYHAHALTRTRTPA